MIDIDDVAEEIAFQAYDLGFSSSEAGDSEANAVLLALLEGDPAPLNAWLRRAQGYLP